MVDIDFVFHPKSIAIVGGSSNPEALASRNFLRPLPECNYQGSIYPVNPHLSEAMGFKTYYGVLNSP